MQKNRNPLLINVDNPPRGLILSCHEVNDMKSEVPFILGVDDEAMNREILYELFQEEHQKYEIQCVQNGLLCLEKVSQCKPDLILLDVNMPGINGLETCRQLRQLDECIDIPIIFVSALASKDERLAGYEAGGDDYITKPFNADELLKKIELRLNDAKKRKALEVSKTDSWTMANIAMDSCFELGSILKFIKGSFKCSTYQMLADKVFMFLGSMGLKGSLMLKVKSGNQVFFPDGIGRPLEKDLLEKVHTHGERIFENKKRLVFNSHNAVLLIRNMNFSEEILGRYRDHFAILIEGIDARVGALDSEFDLKEKQQTIIEAIELTRNGLIKIDHKHQVQRAKNAKIISELNMDLENAFVHLGLDEKQEQFLLELVQNMERKTDSLYAVGLDLDKQFDGLIRHLNELAKLSL